MPARAVAGDGNPRWISAILLRVFLNVGDRAVDIFDQVGHRVGSFVAIARADPAVVDAGDDIAAIANQLAGQAAHDVFGVARPPAAVNDDDARQIARAAR